MSMALQILDSLIMEFQKDMTEADVMTIRSIKSMALKGPFLMLPTQAPLDVFIEQLKDKNYFMVQLYQGHIKEALNILEHALVTDSRRYLQPTIISNLLLLKEVESEHVPSKAFFRKQLAEKIAHHGGDGLHWNILGSHL